MLRARFFKIHLCGLKAVIHMMTMINNNNNNVPREELVMICVDSWPCRKDMNVDYRLLKTLKNFEAVENHS